MTNSKILILCGPTAVGKTALSLNLAQQFNAETVCVDSQTILKGFDIGTAKPNKSERKQVVHHLLDIVEYGDLFDVASFVHQADEAIFSIQSKNKLPLLCGGAGLYFKALLQGIMEAPKRDDALRLKLEERIKSEGLLSLYKELQKLDEERAAQIHPNDSIRIVRALEMIALSGQKPSVMALSHQFKDRRYSSIKIGLRLPLEVLYERINQRVLHMIELGWIKEVQRLLNEGCDLINGKTQALGYKILAEHLSGKFSLDEAVAKIQQETRNFAKRQMTWFRADNEIKWFEPNKEKELLQFVKKNLQS